MISRKIWVMEKWSNFGNFHIVWCLLQATTYMYWGQMSKIKSEFFIEYGRSNFSLWIENRNLKKRLYTKKNFFQNEVTCTRHMVIESSLWQFVEENCWLGTSSKTIYILELLKIGTLKNNSIFQKNFHFFFFQLTIMMMTNLSKLQENKDLQTSFYIM